MEKIALTTDEIREIDDQIAAAQVLNSRHNRHRSVQDEAMMVGVANVDADRRANGDQLLSSTDKNVRRKGLTNLLDPRLVCDEEYAALLKIHFRAETEKTYRPLVRNLTLSSTEREQFFELLVERRLASAEIQAMAQLGGVDMRVPDSRRKITAIIGKLERDIDSQIRSLLGSAAVEYYEYQRRFPVKQQIDILSARLDYTDSPLTPEQSEALVATMLDLGRHEGAVRPGSALTAETAIAAAAKLLNDRQMAALEELRVEQDARRRLNVLRPAD